MPVPKLYVVSELTEYDVSDLQGLDTLTEVVAGYFVARATRLLKKRKNEQFTPIELAAFRVIRFRIRQQQHLPAARSEFLDICEARGLTVVVGSTRYEQFPILVKLNGKALCKEDIKLAGWTRAPKPLKV